MFVYDAQGNKIRKENFSFQHDNNNSNHGQRNYNNAVEHYGDGKKTKKWVWYVLGAVGVILLILLIWYLVKRKSNSSKSLQRFGFRFY